MKIPRNELETILLFDRILQDFFEILSLQPARFPDAVVLEKSSGKQFRVEFEFMASSFIEHEHDPSKCDVIACWVNDLDKSIRFPIWEISTRTFDMVFTPSFMELENFRLKIENVMLKRAQRRDGREYAPDWRTARKQLTNEQVKEIATMSGGSIAYRYGVDERTARNWRKYAQKEL